MTTRKKTKAGVIILCLIVILILGTSLYIAWHFHWHLTLQQENFTESSRDLVNPNRGFYYIYGFRITDESVDWNTEITKRMESDPDNELALIEVNLQAYRSGAISDAGMQNMKMLFAALAQQEKQYIVRFLYDWDGQNEQYEPQDINIIVGHIKQAESVLCEYADHIFTLQGLFVGNWGEMNGTQYVDDDSLQRLASTLAEVSNPDTYLSVRMPMHWRKITQTSDIQTFLQSDSPYVHRLGLFNDGMLGNEGDYGTYGTQSRSQAGDYSAWTREEELDFQDELCRTVPNGGEVIIDNAYNDLDHAIADFNRMHITYLNEDYDRNVLEKWSNSVVHTDDCYDGMDGLSYMKARLGYRFVLRECRMQQDFWKDTLHVELDVSNSGFAPIYKACEACFVFVPQSSEGKTYSVNVEQNLSELAGGNETDRISTIQTTIPLHDLERENYDVYFQLKDQATGEMIQFANEQECEAEGYQIGQILQ